MPSAAAFAAALTLGLALGLTTATAALAQVAPAQAAPAQAAPDSPVTFGLGGATDYALRGVSQTRNRPNVFASVDAEFGQLGYAGVWASNVDLDNGARAEIDVYGGVRPRIGPVTVDLGVIRYIYAGQEAGPHADYTEVKLAPSMTLGPATFAAAWYHSEDYFGAGGPSNYLEASATVPIGSSPFSVSGAVGRQQVKGPDDYVTWNLGVGYAFRRNLGFDLRYWDTDSHGLGGAYGSKLVLGLKATFP
jgi:uncharacterized protein (TIGR02001 family)